jgi:hypothetical protein
MRFAYRLQRIDAEGFIKAADQAIELGPLKDPESWRKGKTLLDARAVAVALKEFQDKTCKLLGMESEFPREEFWELDLESFIVDQPKKKAEVKV